MPRNSIVFLFLNHFSIKARPFSMCLTISVREMWSLSSIEITVTSVSCTFTFAIPICIFVVVPVFVANLQIIFDKVCLLEMMLPSS